MNIELIIKCVTTLPDCKPLYKVTGTIKNNSYTIGYYYKEDLHIGIKKVTDHIIKEYLDERITTANTN